MRRALEETKAIAGAYKGSKTKDYVREDENGDIVLCSDFGDDQSEVPDDESVLAKNYDIAELVTDNQVLLDRVDALLGGEETEAGFSTHRSTGRSDEIESLTSSLIDGLYN